MGAYISYVYESIKPINVNKIFITFLAAKMPQSDNLIDYLSGDDDDIIDSINSVEY